MGKDIAVKEQGGDLISFSKEQIDLIKKQFFPKGANDVEFQYCMGVAKNLGLDPILKQIYFVPRKTNIAEYGQPANWVEKIEPLAGRDAFLSLAHRSGKFAGIEVSTKIENTPYYDRGEWKELSDLTATAIVYRTDTEKPFTATVGYREYVATTNKGEPTKFWREKPETMLKKVAESQALRKAFNVSGLYIEEEINDTERPKVKSEPTKIVKILDKKEEVEEVEVIEEIIKITDITDFYKSLSDDLRPKAVDIMNMNDGWREYGQEDLKVLSADLQGLLNG